jgi:hypothetical protein
MESAAWVAPADFANVDLRAGNFRNYQMIMFCPEEIGLALVEVADNLATAKRVPAFARLQEVKKKSLIDSAVGYSLYTLQPSLGCRAERCILAAIRIHVISRPVSTESEMDVRTQDH